MAKALVVIDMQKGFCNELTSHLPRKICDFIKEHGDDFDCIIGTKYVNHSESACYKYGEWYDCMEGSEDCELVDGLEELCDTVFTKDTFSCWNGEFKWYIKSRDIDELVFIGVNTACCVLASMFGAFDSVHSVKAIEDLCGSTEGVSNHNLGIEVMKECFLAKSVVKLKDYIDYI